MVYNPDLLDGSKWDDEDIVISGISGRFPECDSIQEFEDKLLDGIDLVRDDPRRWQTGLYGTVTRYGMLKDLSRFDSKFFNIHPKQAQKMDPQIRNLLEVAHEAIVDAGLHPEDLSGTKTGVIVGVASSETQDKCSQMPDKINGYEYIGCTRTMFANRVSYMYNLKGPSYSIDTASSTTLVAFQQGYDLIKDGICDAVFVCGTDLVLNPCVCLMFQCLNMLSPDGKCKAFDASGDGYVRSEGAIAVLLQKAKVAKRVYAKVLGAGSNCDGYKDDGITFPSGPQQVVLFKRVAQIAGINPAEIDFMEAHGSATRVGDPQEMNAVTEVFTTGRSGPLRTGSIKSNMGHGEPASALSAVVKICIAMECGVIPPNLHYHNPNPDIPALLDGRLKVITEPTPWNGGVVAVNSFGVGGANGHALLLSNKKSKVLKPDSIPRLVCVSGVTENAVKFMLNKINDLPRDPEFYALVSNVHRKHIKGHQFRGYIVLDGNSGIHIEEDINNYDVCLVIPGIFNQQTNIGSGLLKMDIFTHTVDKCQTVINSVDKKIDLRQIFNSFGSCDILSAVLGITTLQIGLIDILRDLRINPRYIIGFNIGEIASGYANGVYTTDKAILAAYAIGSLLKSSTGASGVAALIDDCWDSDKYSLPENVSVIAHISCSCTLVSGPSKSVEEFCQQLQLKGINTQIVDSHGIDFRTSAVPSELIPQFKQKLDKVLPHYYATEQWLSYSYTTTNMSNTNTTTKTVPSHLLNSITSTLLFQEAIESIPEKLIFVEAGVGSFLSQILKPLCKQGSKYVNLLSENATVEELLDSIGRLFNKGLQPQIQHLYPPVSFPVSHGTPKIQSLIEWDHSVKWDVVSFAAKDPALSGEVNIVIYFDKDEYSFLPGNMLYGKHVFPKSFYLMLLWKALSRLLTKPILDIPMVVENICFVRETNINENDGFPNFYVNLLNGSGKFEIWENNGIVVFGTVRVPAEIAKEHSPVDFSPKTTFDNGSEITKPDIYRDLSIKGYQYNDAFQSLTAYDCKNDIAVAEWKSNWTTFLESILQLVILQSEPSKDQCILSHIKKLVIDPKLHLHESQDSGYIINYNKQYNVFKSNGIEIEGVTTKYSSFDFVQPLIECCEFVPFISSGMSDAKSVEASLRFALENLIGYNSIKIAETASSQSFDALIAPQISDLYPDVQIDVMFYSYSMESLSSSFVSKGMQVIRNDFSSSPSKENFHLIISANILSNAVLLQNLTDSVIIGGFILSKERHGATAEDRISDLKLVATSTNDNFSYVLFKKVPKLSNNNTEIINFDENNTKWFTKLKNLVDQPNTNIVIVGRGDAAEGVTNILRNIKTESPDKIISAVFVDKNGPEFSLTNPVFSNQLEKTYLVNVLKNGIWGCYLSFKIDKNVKIATENASICVSDNGVHFVKASHSICRSKSNASDIVCKVFCIAVNDVSKDIGMEEFSGVDELNNRVLGLVPGVALATSVCTTKEFVWAAPSNWSFEEATTVPLAYTIAYYGFLLSNTKLETVNTVLVYGATSISAAIVNVATHQKKTMFVVVQTESEKSCFESAFPQVLKNRIFVSNKNNFYLHILQATNGKGVDVVFNTLKTDTHRSQAFVNSLSENGRFINFESEIPVDDSLGSAGNMRCITFCRISLQSLFMEENVEKMKCVSKLIKTGLQSGEIQPLVFVSCNTDSYKFAWRNTSFEKMVVNISDRDDQVFSAIPSTYFDPKKSFVILGGGSRFGIYVTNWAISRGMKNVIVVAKNKFDDQLYRLYANRWKDVTLQEFVATDCSLKTCETIIKKAERMSPVGGIFDLTDFDIKMSPSFKDFNENDFIQRFSNKIEFSKNMDKLSRKSCPQLNFFVVFSVITNHGIKDYINCSYTASQIENIVRERKSSNYPASVLEWGIVGENLLHTEYNSDLSGSQLECQSVISSIQTLDMILQLSDPVVSTCLITEQTASVLKSKASVVIEGVAKFLGIKDPSSIRPTVTMLDLGLDSLIATDIQHFLECNYKLILSTQEIRELSFESLKNLVETL